MDIFFLNTSQYTNLEKSLIQIAFILIIVIIIRLILEIIIKKIFSKKSKNAYGKKARINKRLKTILDVVNNLTITIAIVICSLLFLGNFFNLTGILASAGIIGIGISLGAQSIFKDFITGFFFLSQDQFGTGDLVQIGPPYNLTGKIINITLRTVTVKDLSGNVTTIPNSMINMITNLSKDVSIADNIFNFSLEIEIDKVFELLNKAGEKMKEDKEIKIMLLDSLQILGIESMDNGKLSVRTQIKTVPGKQFEISRKFKYIVKKLSEEENLKLS